MYVVFLKGKKITKWIVNTWLLYKLLNQEIKLQKEIIKNGYQSLFFYTEKSGLM